MTSTKKYFQWGIEFIFIIQIVIALSPFVSSLDTIVSVNMASTSNDYASTQGVFSPGPGFYGNLANDYEWKVKLSLSQEKTISSILITHIVAGEAWTTTSQRYFGKDIYPLVIFLNNNLLNNQYNQEMQMPSGESTLSLYGQIESTPFQGGEIIIIFTDGTSLNATIPQSVLAIEPINIEYQECIDSDNGADYTKKGNITYKYGENKIYTYEDKCINDKILSEGMCGGVDGRQKHIVMSHGLCNGGCRNGTCVSVNSSDDMHLYIELVENPEYGKSFGWELTLETSRQKSIELLVLTENLPNSQSNEKRFLPIEAYYNGNILKLANTDGATIFEPGTSKIHIYPRDNQASYQGGSLSLIFADGYRIFNSLLPINNTSSRQIVSRNVDILAPAQEINYKNAQISQATCEGCVVNGRCFYYGIRLVNVTQKYCDIDNNMKEQKEIESSCNNNFECLSNTCSSGKCIDIIEKIEKQQNRIDKIFSWLKSFFGFSE